MAAVVEPEPLRAEGLNSDDATDVAQCGIDVSVCEVLDGGPFTTVQDFPGRIGYWHVGVPPSGPMDDLSHRLVNRVVGNAMSAATLELTRSGPTVRFSKAVTIALGGASMPLLIDSQAAPPWTPVTVSAGAIVTVGAIDGPGLRAYLAIRGGIATTPYLGSRATFTLGGFGGCEGRALRAGDMLPIGHDVATPPAPLAPGAAPRLMRRWEIGVIVGPHAAPDFITTEGLERFFGTWWSVHYNSARTGVRLIGSRPSWARRDGDDAGIHPSNVHDNGYAFAAVDLTGDMPVILGPDGPSLGGFVCPAVVAAAERWKLGQLAPGDTVRLVPRSVRDAEVEARRHTIWIDRVTEPIEPVARPPWNERLGRPRERHSPVIAHEPAEAGQHAVTIRQAGDRFVLMEMGAPVLDLGVRLRIHAIDAWAREHLGPGLVDATAGVRSLLVHVDGSRLTTAMAVVALREACRSLDDLADQPFRSRVVHLPLSWDDPATREAIARYMHGVRADAPWCPWNIEFIRRVNGLATVDDVHRIVFDASYLVLGLGDVYLGAPVATPLDPRHRLVTTKYNPARTWTPENAVGIGGAYLCIYGMEGPGGYQFVGRTVQVWNRDALGPHFEEPWLLRPFDQIRWYPVTAEELLDLRAAQSAGDLAIRMDHTTFRLAEHERFLSDNAAEIERFRVAQQEAFAAERVAWADIGELDR